MTALIALTAVASAGTVGGGVPVVMPAPLQTPAPSVQNVQPATRPAQVGLHSAPISTQVSPRVNQVTLAGYAEMPADTFAPGPASGAWNGDGLRGEARFAGQPVQGFSAVQRLQDGTYLFLTDNGFGTKANSADALLRLNRLSFSGQTQPGGTAKVLDWVQLRDPDRRVNWRIVNENTAERLLTGSDFDPEGFVIAPDGTLWVGDEFGPYLLHFSADGRLLEAPIPTPNLAGLPTLHGQAPIVIGHRGSSGTRPEHTLESYRAAIAGGADFIEPDLVVTKDGVLVARHEPVIAVIDDKGNVTEATADVHDHPEFRDRLTTKTLDGQPIHGYFVEDFTLAELKTLRAMERLPKLRGTVYDHQFEIPTLSEVIALVRDEEARTGRKVGIYSETKHPTYMNEVAHQNTSQLLIDTLVREKFTDPSRVFIQSFEVSNLKDLRQNIMPGAGVNLPLIQLVSSDDEPAYDLVAAGDKRTPKDMLSDAGLREIATYAAGVGPYKRWIVDDKCQPTDFISRAHAAGLAVHTWTLRSEPVYLLPCYGGDPKAEMRQYLRLGLDGYFTDFPATGAEVAREYTAAEVRSPQNPAFANGQPNAANLPASGGFEGLALSPDGRTIYGLLEKTVQGDKAGTLRLHAFDLASRRWSLAGRLRLDKETEAIGDLAPVNNRQYLVIERDNKEGAAARAKRIYLLDLDRKNADGTIYKTLVADLMNIADPQGLSPNTAGGVLKFPYFTIENVLVLDKNTILVANDNNYPATGGRGKDVKDKEEFLWLRLPTELNVAR